MLSALNSICYAHVFLFPHMIMDLLISDVETKQKTTITFNRVTVLLYLTHLFVYSIIISEGF